MSSPASLTLIVPGLIWPRQALADLTQGLQTPGLCSLLGKGHFQRAPGQTPASALMSALGLPAGSPAAPARRRALGHAPDKDRWLCLDPVHLGFVERQLSLADPARLALTAVEANALAVSLAPTFAKLGALVVDTPQTWHLRLDKNAPLPTSPDLPDLVGQRADRVLSGLDPLWRQILNEAQMQLHTHPVNQAREVAGELTVNSLWPWGGGVSPQPVAPPRLDRVYANDLAVRGFAALAGIDGQPLPSEWSEPVGEHLLVCLDSLTSPAQQADAQRWRETLITLERQWFARLATRPPPLLTVLFADPRGSVSLRYSRYHRLAFWRATVSLTRLALQ